MSKIKLTKKEQKIVIKAIALLEEDIRNNEIHPPNNGMCRYIFISSGNNFAHKEVIYKLNRFFGELYRYPWIPERYEVILGYVMYTYYTREDQEQRLTALCLFLEACR